MWWAPSSVHSTSYQDEREHVHLPSPGPLREARGSEPRVRPLCVSLVPFRSDISSHAVELCAWAQLSRADCTVEKPCGGQTPRVLWPLLPGGHPGVNRPDPSASSTGPRGAYKSLDFKMGKSKSKRRQWVLLLLEGQPGVGHCTAESLGVLARYC